MENEKTRYDKLRDLVLENFKDESTAVVKAILERLSREILNHSVIRGK